MAVQIAAVSVENAQRTVRKVRKIIEVTRFQEETARRLRDEARDVRQQAEVTICSAVRKWETLPPDQVLRQIA